MTARSKWLRSRLAKKGPPLCDRLAYGAAHLAVVAIGAWDRFIRAAKRPL